MNDKTLIGIGIAAVATPLLALMIFNGTGASSARSPATQNATPAASQLSIASMQSPVGSKIDQPPGEDGALPASGVQVTPAEQENLAQMVGLSENASQPFNKEKWEKAIPIAEKLLAQSADCEQRNWLTQFVAVGKLAMEESPDFRQYAPMLATMYRDKNELKTGQPSN